MSILNSAASGLKTAQSLLNTTARNVTNADTPGYTRKTQNAVTGPLGNANPGEITRSVNEFLIQDLRRATSAQTYQETLTTALKHMDSLNGAPDSELSLGSRIDALGNAFQDLATEPSSSVAYVNTVDTAKSLATTLNRHFSDIQAIRFDARQNRAVDVGIANEVLGEIADLNLKISEGIAAGRDVTDRQDQRDQLALELSEIIEIRTFVNDRGVMNVFTSDFRQLANERAKTLTIDSDDRILINDDPLGKLGGTLGAYAEIESRSVDRLAELDVIAFELARAFGEDDGPEIDLFVDGDGDVPENLPADRDGYASIIQVRQELLDSPSQLRTERERLDLDPDDHRPVGDSTILNRARQVFLQPRDFDVEPDAPDGYRGIFSPTLNNVTLTAAAGEMTAAVANQVRRSENLMSETTVSVGFLQNELAATTDVNIDDEMARMIVLQQLYGASARVISVTQQMLDELLNSVR